jgi:hypothetical protein
VHSTRLERLGEGLNACSSEVVAAHLGTVFAVEASASRCSDAMPKSSVVASRMEDVVHASVDEPYSGF